MSEVCTQDTHVGELELRRRGQMVQHQCPACLRGVGRSVRFLELPASYRDEIPRWQRPKPKRQPNSKRREYEKHLKSKDWKDLRQEVFERDNYTCQRCEEGPLEEQDLEVDHKTYKRLGAERPEDCQTLCKFCHREVTEERLLASVFGR